ncbi:TerC/Alx family metal homeostasis membrane protein [Haloferula sargassicola]|uniref:Membrane-bound redox modulator Alx n=1 Tax=Haloferula sargassicola TaxID=490096 RepID=A0ABP9ULD2_9BACT
MNAASETPLGVWGLFAGVVGVLLAADLLAYRGKSSESRRVTLVWSIIWIAAGLGFGGFIAWRSGGELVGEYYAAYAMEKALSIDNLFVFYVIFQSLGVPKSSQHHVLFWGILGAVVFRGIFIFVGVAAIERWEWISYIFGGLLLYAAWHSYRQDPAKQERSRVVDWLSEHLPLSARTDTRHFTLRESGKRVATPLMLALIAIEFSDILFAIDSVPAALSITRDRFVVYSSNIFAILGLRALYLLMAATIAGMRYLHYGLAAVLAFAAVKIVAHPWFDIPPLVSLGVIVAIIGVAVVASLRARVGLRAD